jgi:hypothetical protein
MKIILTNEQHENNTNRQIIQKLYLMIDIIIAQNDNEEIIFNNPNK